MPSALKKVVRLTVAAFLLFTFYFSLITPAFAVTQTHFDNITPQNWSAESQAGFTLDNLMCGVLDILTPGCPYKDKKPIRLWGDSGQVKLVMVDKNFDQGAIGAVGNFLTALYTPPTSSVQYLADAAAGFGIIKPAYAQVPGSGAGIIEPVRTLWQVIRNIVYLLFIVIFLAVGFMIMFRQKINPQTTVTVQQALPGLIVGLILVTFSYFIAALIIDLSFVGIPLVTQIFVQTGQNNVFGSAPALQNLAQNSNIFQLFGVSALQWGNTAGDVWKGVWDITNFNSPTSNASILTTVLGVVVGSIIAPGVGTLLGVVGGAAAGPLVVTGLVSIILPTILTIALFVQMFRLLLGLIGTYIQLLIATITGPFTIIASSIPGRSGGIGGWFKTLLGNALVFPAVFAAFLFAGMILGTDVNNWQASPPLFGGLSTMLLKTLIAYGAIFATPAIPDAVRGALGIKPQQGGLVGAAMGGFSAGWGTLSGAAGGGYGRTTRMTGLQASKAAIEKQEITAREQTYSTTAARQSWGARAIKWFVPSK